MSSRYSSTSRYGSNGYRSQPVSNRTSLYSTADYMSSGLTGDMSDIDRQFKRLMERTEKFTNKVEKLQSTATSLRRGFRDIDRTVTGRSVRDRDISTFNYLIDSDPETTEEQWKRYLDLGILIEKAVELLRQQYRYPKPVFEYSPESRSPYSYNISPDTKLVSNPRSPVDREGKKIRDLGSEIIFKYSENNASDESAKNSSSRRRFSKHKEKISNLAEIEESTLESSKRINRKTKDNTEESSKLSEDKEPKSNFTSKFLSSSTYTSSKQRIDESSNDRLNPDTPATTTPTPSTTKTSNRSALSALRQAANKSEEDIDKQTDSPELTTETTRRRFRSAKDRAASKARPSTLYNDDTPPAVDQSLENMTENLRNKTPSIEVIGPEKSSEKPSEKSSTKSSVKSSKRNSFLDDLSFGKGNSSSRSSFHEYIPGHRIPLKERLRLKQQEQHTGSPTSEINTVIKPSSSLTMRASKIIRAKYHGNHDGDILKDDKQQEHEESRVTKTPSFKSRFLRKFRGGDKENEKEKEKEKENDKKRKKGPKGKDDSDHQDIDEENNGKSPDISSRQGVVNLSFDSSSKDSSMVDLSGDTKPELSEDTSELSTFKTDLEKNINNRKVNVQASPEISRITPRNKRQLRQRRDDPDNIELANLNRKSLLIYEEEIVPTKTRKEKMILDFRSPKRSKEEVDEDEITIHTKRNDNVISDDIFDVLKEPEVLEEVHYNVISEKKDVAIDDSIFDRIYQMPEEEVEPETTANRKLKGNKQTDSSTFEALSAAPTRIEDNSSSLIVATTTVSTNTIQQSPTQAANSQQQQKDHSSSKAFISSKEAASSIRLGINRLPLEDPVNSITSATKTIDVIDAANMNNGNSDTNNTLATNNENTETVTSNNITNNNSSSSSSSNNNNNNNNSNNSICNSNNDTMITTRISLKGRYQRSQSLNDQKNNKNNSGIHQINRNRAQSMCDRLQNPKVANGQLISRNKVFSMNDHLQNGKSNSGLHQFLNRDRTQSTSAVRKAQLKYELPHSKSLDLTLRETNKSEQTKRNVETKSATDQKNKPSQIYQSILDPSSEALKIFAKYSNHTEAEISGMVAPKEIQSHSTEHRQTSVSESGLNKMIEAIETDIKYGIPNSGELHPTTTHEHNEKSMHDDMQKTIQQHDASVGLLKTISCSDSHQIIYEQQQNADQENIPTSTHQIHNAKIPSTNVTPKVAVNHDTSKQQIASSDKTTVATATQHSVNVGLNIEQKHFITPTSSNKAMNDVVTNKIHVIMPATEPPSVTISPISDQETVNYQPITDRTADITDQISVITATNSDNVLDVTHPSMQTSVLVETSPSVSPASLDGRCSISPSRKRLSYLERRQEHMALLDTSTSVELSESLMSLLEAAKCNSSDTPQATAQSDAKAHEIVPERTKTNMETEESLVNTPIEEVDSTIENSIKKTNQIKEEYVEMRASNEKENSPKREDGEKDFKKDPFNIAIPNKHSQGNVNLQKSKSLTLEDRSMALSNSKIFLKSISLESKQSRPVTLSHQSSTNSDISTNEMFQVKRSTPDFNGRKARSIHRERSSSQSNYSSSGRSAISSERSSDDEETLRRNTNNSHAGKTKILEKQMSIKEYRMKKKQQSGTSEGSLSDDDPNRKLSSDLEQPIMSSVGDSTTSDTNIQKLEDGRKKRKQVGSKRDDFFSSSSESEFFISGKNAANNNATDFINTNMTASLSDSRLESHSDRTQMASERRKRYSKRSNAKSVEHF